MDVIYLDSLFGLNLLIDYCLVLASARDVHHQPQVVLDEQGSGLLAPGGERPDGLLLCLAVERGGHGVAPADVKQPRRAAAQPQPQRRPERM